MVGMTTMTMRTPTLNKILTSINMTITTSLTGFPVCTFLSFCSFHCFQLRSGLGSRCEWFAGNTSSIKDKDSRLDVKVGDGTATRRDELWVIFLHTLSYSNWIYLSPHPLLLQLNICRGFSWYHCRGFLFLQLNLSILKTRSNRLETQNLMRTVQSTLI